MKTKAQFSTFTEAQALENLVRASERLVKEARWFPYRSKVNSLRRPLLQLRIARQRAGKQLNEQ